LLGLGEDVAHDALLQIPIPAIAHARLMQLFHQYALIGGMPEAVDLFITTNDFTQLGRIYESVITGYKDDVVKYARTKEEQQLIVHAIESSPLEAGLRIKFAGFGASNYRSREMSESLRTLVKSRLIHLIYPTTMTSPPAKPDKKKSPLLQFLDTGLLNYSLGLQSQILGVEDLNHIHKGIVIEHLVRQEMISIHHEPSFELSFWVRQKPTSNAATDSLITIDKYLIPVEIKSGSVGHLRSLHEYMDACNHPYAIRTHGGKFSVHTATTTRGKQYYLMNLPYYLGTLVNKYAQWFIDQYPIKSVEAISHPQA
jgi:predicted AAA+ superfamily ATPase